MTQKKPINTEKPKPLSFQRKLESSVFFIIAHRQTLTFMTNADKPMLVIASEVQQSLTYLTHLLSYCSLIITH